LQTINHYDVEYKLSKSLVYPQTKQMWEKSQIQFYSTLQHEDVFNE